MLGRIVAGLRSDSNWGGGLAQEHGMDDAVEGIVTQGFGKAIGKVVLRADMDEADDPCSTRFTYAVIGTSMVFLLQDARGNRGVEDDAFVVTEHESWAVDGDTEHTEFVSHFDGKVNAHAGSNKFGTVSGGFDGFLSLG
jgi:hypothetical protein